MLCSFGVTRIFNQWEPESSKSVSWGGGGGVWKTLYIKIGYSEPTRSESREGSSRRRELSEDVCRLGLRNTRFWLADDRLWILIGWWLGWRNSRFWLAADNSSVLGTSRVWSAMYKDMECSVLALCDTFRRLRHFSALRDIIEEKIQKTLGAHRPRGN